MEMLGHQDAPYKLEAEVVANLAQDANEELLEEVGFKQGGAAVSAGGDEVRVIEAVVTGEAKHERNSSAIDRRHGKERRVCATRLIDLTPAAFIKLDGSLTAGHVQVNVNRVCQGG